MSNVNVPAGTPVCSLVILGHYITYQHFSRCTSCHCSNAYFSALFCLFVLIKYLWFIRRNNIFCGCSGESLLCQDCSWCSPVCPKALVPVTDQVIPIFANGWGEVLGSKVALGTNCSNHPAWWWVSVSVFTGILIWRESWSQSKDRRISGSLNE